MPDRPPLSEVGEDLATRPVQPDRDIVTSDRSDYPGAMPGEPWMNVYLDSDGVLRAADGTAIGAGADDGRERRLVRGMNYVAKPGVTPAATFDPADWDFDEKYEPRLASTLLAGHSYTQISPTPGIGWYRNLTRSLGVPDASNIGVSGGAAFGPKGGFPNDGCAAHVLKDYEVQTNPSPLLPGLPGVPQADNWQAWRSMLLAMIGFNDPASATYFGATGDAWEILHRHAFRALLVALRAGRNYTPQSPEVTYTGAWFQAADPLTMGTGPAFLTPGDLGYVSFDLPDDYTGQPISVHWSMNNNAAQKHTNNLYVGGVPKSVQYSNDAVAAARAYGAPASGSNPGGGVQALGVQRVTGLTADDAGKQVLIEYFDAVAYPVFAGVTFEVDAPVVILQVPRIPEAIGQTSEANDRQVDRVNEIQREVIDEFPEHAISLAELAPTNVINDDVGHFVGVGDPHLSASGNIAFARDYVLPALRAAEATTRSLTGATIL